MIDEGMVALAAPYPAGRQSWWMVAILFIAAILSNVDRGILGLVVDPIRHDLDITDVQLSLLQGLAFGLFYASVGLLLGFGADRLPRRSLLMAGVAVWSVATVMCGLAHSFATLFAWRLMVGAGEATLIPVGVSMIADMFPPERRGRPLGLFFLGQTLAAGIAIALTGVVLSAVAAGLLGKIPGLSGLPAWRATFVICGGLGGVAVLLLATTREPLRRAGPSAGEAHSASARQWFKRRWPIFLPFYVGFSLLSVGVYGTGAWAPSVLIRQYGAAAADVGKTLGLASMAAAIGSALLAAYLVDRIARSGRRDGHLLLLAAVALLEMPCAFATFAPTAFTATLALAWWMLFYPLASIAFSAVVQNIVPSGMRGFSMAIALLSNTLIGSTAGTYMIAAVTEHVYRDPARIGMSLLTVLVPCLSLACGCFVVAGAALRRALRRQREASGPAVAGRAHPTF